MGKVVGVMFWGVGFEWGWFVFRGGRGGGLIVLDWLVGGGGVWEFVLCLLS